MVLAKTKITKPDLVEFSLTLILAIWSILIVFLIKQATASISQLTIDALAMFFTAFISISLLIIAILIADIRKEIKKIY
ncbi:MAG: hypothetical protein ACP5IJ_01320 [Candidatus Nanoarchaeia archaeon]